MNADSIENKSDLRQKLLARRLAIPSVKREEISLKITSRLEKIIEWNEAKNIHCYQTWHEKGELDTSAFIDLALEKGTEVYTTPLDYKDQVVLMKVRNNKLVESTNLQFDYIIVPVLGFDSSNFRLGYGRGYYDRFLKGQERAKKIGIAFESSRMDSLPVEDHDVALDLIMTEKE